MFIEDYKQIKKYTLIVKIKNRIEAYYSDYVNKLEQYAELRKFKDYKIYELKEVKDEVRYNA